MVICPRTFCRGPHPPLKYCYLFHPVRFKMRGVQRRSVLRLSSSHCPASPVMAVQSWASSVQLAAS